MTDWFRSSIDLQKQMLGATAKSLDAGKGAVDMGATMNRAMVDAQEASRKAMEANMAAWQAWMTLWGVGR